ncbi:hypothetical protein BAE44_0001311 [Dichanthelium oligosanthes]|uniref:PGG domain-containing protein n=1 Tax=Dichanthelium oligosanthes TaxID=888268 RepID=A0A1E5WKK5_9POAL|nr:hypothetical protein BAE44_0001311 [Dichanthelium oligosanthes]
MTLAVLDVSVTYQAGLNPPGGFLENRGIGHEAAGAPVLESINPNRYNVFFYSNTTAFLTSLAIIILLMNRSFYVSEAKVVAPEIIVVLDMVGLMAAYWAGSTRREQTAMYTLVLSAIVLIVIYAVYAVQLVPKLPRLVDDVLRRRVRGPRRTTSTTKHGRRC